MPEGPFVLRDPQRDPLERRVRLVCGALLGLLVALLLWFQFGPFSPLVWILVLLVCASGGALLALRYGDNFWHQAIESLRALG